MARVSHYYICLAKEVMILIKEDSSDLYSCFETNNIHVKSQVRGMVACHQVLILARGNSFNLYSCFKVLQVNEPKTGNIYIGSKVSWVTNLIVLMDQKTHKDKGNAYLRAFITSVQQQFTLQMGLLTCSTISIFLCHQVISKRKWLYKRDKSNVLVIYTFSSS